MSNEQREAYRKQAEAKLDEIEARIEVAKAKARAASAGVESDVDAQIASLQELWGEARSQLDDLSEATEDAFEGAKARWEGAWDALSAKVSRMSD